MSLRTCENVVRCGTSLGRFVFQSMTKYVIGYSCGGLTKDDVFSFSAQQCSAQQCSSIDVVWGCSVKNRKGGGSRAQSYAPAYLKLQYNSFFLDTQSSVNNTFNRQSCLLDNCHAMAISSM